MLRDAAERALYELTTDRSARERFAADPDRALDRYPIDDDVRDQIRSVDARALLDLGVNPMLTWGFWMMATGGSRAEYLAAVGPGAGAL